MIYLDCSFISREPDKQSGIQRVTRSITCEMSKLSSKVCPAVFAPDMNFYELENIPQPGDAPFSRQGRQVVFRNNDMYFILDSIWDRKILDRLLPFKLRGLMIGVVFYDLFPITHPQFSGIAKDFFLSWLTDTLKYSDFFACISQATARTLRQQAAEVYPFRFLDKKSVFSFPLGADLPASDSEYQPSLRLLKQAFGDDTYLIVSTLEPRKNHELLLDVFDGLWKKFPSIKLCFIGRYGWMTEKLVDRIRAHPLKNRRLFWFDGLTDADVQWAYRQAKCILYPSFAEGFGLPIVEALHYKKPVLASDIPVFHEIAGDRIGYFDPERPDELTAWIERMEEKGVPENLKPDPSFRWLTWRESARVLLKKMTETDEYLRSERFCRSEGERTVFVLPQTLNPMKVKQDLGKLKTGDFQKTKETVWIPKERYLFLREYFKVYDEALNRLRDFERIEPVWEIRSHRKILAPLAIGVKKLLRRFLRSFVGSGWVIQSEYNRNINQLLRDMISEISSLQVELAELKKNCKKQTGEKTND